MSIVIDDPRTSRRVIAQKAPGKKTIKTGGTRREKWLLRRLRVRRLLRPEALGGKDDRTPDQSSLSRTWQTI
jgi:hypothetical protein